MPIFLIRSYNLAELSTFCHKNWTELLKWKKNNAKDWGELVSQTGSKYSLITVKMGALEN